MMIESTYSKNQEESIEPVQNLNDQPVYKVKTSDQPKFKQLIRKSAHNKNQVVSILKKNPLECFPLEVESIEEEKVSEKVLNAYKEKKLYKGAQEVFSAICFDSSLFELYIVGYTDQTYELRLHSALKAKVSEELKIKRIPVEFSELVYSVLKQQPSYKNVKREIPRRHFFCRFFAIRK